MAKSGSSLADAINAFRAEQAEKDEELIDGLEPERMRQIELIRKDPKFYLWGVDPLDKTSEFPKGRPLCWTIDRARGTKAVKPFPRWPYLERTLDKVTHSGHRKVAIEKPRQMLLSWLLLGFLDWECAFLEHHRWLVSKTAKRMAERMIVERVHESLHTQWPAWLRAWVRPRYKDSEGLVVYQRNHGSLEAMPENLDVSSRGEQPSGILVDECDFHPRLADIVGMADPMDCMILLCSTPGKGRYRNSYYNQILDEKED